MISVREFIISKESDNLRSTIRRNYQANSLITKFLKNPGGCLVAMTSVDENGVNFVSHLAIRGTVENPEFMSILRRECCNQSRRLPYYKYVRAKSLKDIQRFSNLMKTCQR